MQSSESTSSLIKALVKAQSEFEPVKKTVTNTFFKSKYATLDDVLASVLPVLSKNSLAIFQPLETLENGDTMLETRIIHTSGEWISTKAKVPTLQQKGANLLQEFGIGITYMRRYMLSSMLGISTEDDNDGNKPRKQNREEKQKPFDPKAVTDSTFGNDWIAMVEKAVKHLDNVTDVETAKAAIKAHFGDAKSTPLKGFLYLRDEYNQDDGEVF